MSTVGHLLHQQPAVLWYVVTCTDLQLLDLPNGCSHVRASAVLRCISHPREEQLRGWPVKCHQEKFQESWWNVSVTVQLLSELDSSSFVSLFRNPSFVGFVVLGCPWVRCRVRKCGMHLCLCAAAEFAIIQVQVGENVCLCGRSGDALLKSRTNDIHGA